MNSMRPISRHSRVSVSDARGDSVAAGQARVFLKLGAIGYVMAQIGISANIDIAGAALEAYCETAVRYWEAVTGRKFDREIDHAEAKKLVVAALQYVNGRHGVDATQEMARAGMAKVCEAAILFCEGILAR